MTTSNTTFDPGEPERYVYCELPRCPKCGALEHRVYGHGHASDSVKEQYAQCLRSDCQHKFKIIWE